MKIHEKKPVYRKVKRGFLFFPKSINGVTRWLEFAIWEKKWAGDGGGFMGGQWEETKWLDLKRRKQA